jgi:ethanolamine utilization microcompartment shell protein EutS
MELTTSDCLEISCALGDEELMEKIGIDGEDLADGTVILTPGEAETCYFALNDKRERVLEGFYDDKAGDVAKTGSDTNIWAGHMASIMAKLASLAEGGAENHVETSLHLAGCAACQLAYDQRLPSIA